MCSALTFKRPSRTTYTPTNIAGLRAAQIDWSRLPRTERITAAALDRALYLAAAYRFAVPRPAEPQLPVRECVR